MIDELDLSITTNADDTTLTANANNVTYQWINCDGNTIISEENNKYFRPFNTGSYAVIIEDEICKDTSDCVYLIGTGIENVDNANITIYPNPTDNNFIIDNDVVRLNYANKNLTVLTDKVDNSFYIYNPNLSELIIENINLTTGKTSIVLKIKEIVYPKKIRINNGWLYFIKNNGTGFHKLYRIKLMK